MPIPSPGWPVGNGDMPARFRTHAWGDSSLGPVAEWPTALRTTLDLVLACEVPMLVLWGERLVQLYNDAYARLWPAGHAGAFAEPLQAHAPAFASWEVYDRVRGGETIDIEGLSLPAAQGNGDARLSRFSHSPLRDASGAIAGVLVSVMAADASAIQEAADERERALARDLQHRLRNLLVVLRSVVRRTARSRMSLPEYVAHLDDRIAALARTHSIIWQQGVPLETMIYEELLAQRAPTARVAVEGPEVLLLPRTAQVVGLTLHELALNAVEFGAFDSAEGRLEVRWTIDRGREPWVTLTWREHGVSTPAKPGPAGFGTELITRQLPYELDGDSLIQFHPDGIEAVIRFPVPGGVARIGRIGGSGTG